MLKAGKGRRSLMNYWQKFAAPGNLNLNGEFFCVCVCVCVCARVWMYITHVVGTLICSDWHVVGTRLPLSHHNVIVITCLGWRLKVMVTVRCSSEEQVRRCKVLWCGGLYVDTHCPHPKANTGTRPSIVACAEYTHRYAQQVRYVHKVKECIVSTHPCSR